MAFPGWPNSIASLVRVNRRYEFRGNQRPFLICHVWLLKLKGATSATPSLHIRLIR